MTQISRPFQIALVAMGLFAAIWFLALRGHSSSNGGEGSGSSTPTSSASASTAATVVKSTPSAPTLPGVAGLTRAIEKAHGAVAQSERNARQLQQKAAQATSPGASTTGAPSSTAGTKAGARATHAAAVQGATGAAKSPAGAAVGAIAATKSKAGGTPVLQAPVERALKRGQLAMLLFWNPKGSVDQTVHRELQAVGSGSRGKVAVFAAGASQIGAFGPFTRAVQVDQTPTIVIVNGRGQATTLTGLADRFAIEQAIGEAER